MKGKVGARRIMGLLVAGMIVLGGGCVGRPAAAGTNSDREWDRVFGPPAAKRAEPAMDGTAMALTIEQVNAEPVKYSGKVVTFRNIWMSGNLEKNEQMSLGGPPMPTRFVFAVLSANGKRFDTLGYVNGELMFAVSPDMAGKLAGGGLNANLAYSANLTGRIGQMGFNIKTGWTTFVTQIDFVDKNGEVVGTLTAAPPSAR